MWFVTIVLQALSLACKTVLVLLVCHLVNFNVLYR